MFACADVIQWPASAQHRQQHRRTLDGRLCAAAFVFDRQTHTGCSDGTNPAGEHGREWCYVDAQVARASGIRVRCLQRVFRYCNACSYWMVVAGSLPGAIAVIHITRRMGGSALGRLHFFKQCHGAQRARLFAAPGDAFLVFAGCPVMRAAPRMRAYCVSRRYIHGAPCSGRLRSIAVASPRRVCIQD